MIILQFDGEKARTQVHDPQPVSVNLFLENSKKVKEEIGLPDIVVNNAGSYYLQVEIKLTPNFEAR